MSTELIPGELIYYAHRLDKSFKELEIIPIADIHYGNPLFSLRHLNKVRDYIMETDNRFTILNGDLIECVIKSSKGDIFSQKESIQKQRDWIVDFFTPCKDRILGMTTGNHEMRVYRETSIDISADIAKALGCPYRPEGILIKISFGDNNNRTKEKPYTYFIYSTHGYGGARTKSAKAVKVERMSTWIHADCYIQAHDHVVNVAPDIYLMPDNRTSYDEKTGLQTGTIRALEKKLVKCNSFLKWGGYSESGGFPPTDLEKVVIKLTGTGKPKVKVEI